MLPKEISKVPEPLNQQKELPKEIKPSPNENVKPIPISINTADLLKTKEESELKNLIEIKNKIDKPWKIKLQIKQEEKMPEKHRSYIC